MERKRTMVKSDWQSLAVPAVLMLTGVLLVVANGLGLLSLDRIQNLWPAVVILVGISELTAPGEKVPVSTRATYSVERQEKRNG